MILYPGATYHPTTNAGRAKVMTVRDFVCEHTMVASFSGVDANWHAPGYSGSFAHFMVRGDGFVKQTQDLELRAAANLDGNFNCISIENADKGETFPTWTNAVPAFTDAQVEANIALVGWLCDRFDIPTFLTPDTKPGRRGIAYHRQGIAGNYVPYDGIVPGGVRWSNATGKICPGDARINQLKTKIIPAVAAPPTPPPTGGLDVKVRGYLIDNLDRLLERRNAKLSDVFPQLTIPDATAPKGYRLKPQDATLYDVDDVQLIEEIVVAFETGAAQPPNPQPIDYDDIAAHMRITANG